MNIRGESSEVNGNRAGDGDREAEVGAICKGVASAASRVIARNSEVIPAASVVEEIAKGSSGKIADRDPVGGGESSEGGNEATAREFEGRNVRSHRGRSGKEPSSREAKGKALGHFIFNGHSLVSNGCSGCLVSNGCASARVMNYGLSICVRWYSMSHWLPHG